eukprot:COSAG01_NODE_18809_length_1051_cov_3.023109_1_plen_148_part_00
MLAQFSVILAGNPSLPVPKLFNDAFDLAVAFLRCSDRWQEAAVLLVSITQASMLRRRNQGMLEPLTAIVVVPVATVAEIVQELDFLGVPLERHIVPQRRHSLQVVLEAGWATLLQHPRVDLVVAQVAVIITTGVVVVATLAEDLGSA